MTNDGNINRRDLIAKTAGVAGAAGIIGSSTLVRAQPSAVPPPGFADQAPFAERWTKQLSDIVQIDLAKAAPEIADPNVDLKDREAVKERHRIYCYLLMALVQRFWNGNKHGPIGFYPGRAAQIAPNQAPNAKNIFRYRGDDTRTDDPLRVSWDRYAGHNIACLAVDESGEIIDFEFNHNEFFRSSAEHAESRMVRRLYTLTQDFDTWKDRNRSGGETQTRTRSKRISLNHVTLYTSLESCAQCSGVMSLASIRRVIYLQNDFTAYQIGNIMFNLADPGVSPIPIPASAIGLEEFGTLNKGNLDFGQKIIEAKKNPKDLALTGAFYIPPTPDGTDLQTSQADFSPSITSFLCTDVAYDLFAAGAAKLKSQPLKFPNNQHYQNEALEFFKYADLEGFRGSPHRP